MDHLGKFDGKAIEGFFVGYSTNSKAFRVFNSTTRIVEENLHVQFRYQSNGSAGTKACDNVGKARVETVPGKDYILLPLWTQDPPFSSSSKDSPDAGFKPSGEEEKKDAEDPGNEDKNNVVDENIVYGCAEDPNMPELEEIGIFSDAKDDNSGSDMNNLDIYFQVSPAPTTRIHRDHPVEKIIGDLNSTPQTRRMTKSLNKHEEPKKVVQALKDPSWIEAMQEELLQFKLQEVWTLVKLPTRKRAIGTKWVFMNNKDEKGIMIKYKARLVAQWLFLAYASFKDFVVYQMDVKSAFLYGKIEEEVYVCQPPGFEDPNFPDRVYKVEKALYGLHQASKAWYETLSTYLLDNGFQRGKIDKDLFIKKDKGDILLVQVYVDDIIFGSTKKSLCTDPKEDGIFISQDKYVNEILNKFGFSDVKTASTPMETHKPLLKDVNEEDVDEHLYRSMIGSLMYLTSSRPDIIYLKGQPKLGLWYPKDSPFDLVYILTQTVVANSTTEAEYIAASNCCGQSTICIVKNPVFHSKTKHIEIRHHFIRDSNEKKLIHMVKIHTDQIFVSDYASQKHLMLADFNI
ncbi:putative ribonuclease H-like domain-containing protein [Tanacetum coccineum]